MRGELEKGDERIDAPRELRLAKQVVAAEYAQVLLGRERLDQNVLLKGDTQPGSHGAWIAGDIDPEDEDPAAARSRDPIDHAQRCRFSCAVRTQEAEAHTGRNL